MKRTRQPQGAVRINSASPYHPASFLWTPTAPLNAVTKKLVTYGGTGSPPTLRGGLSGIEAYGSSSQYVVTDVPATACSALTWLALIRPDAAPSATGYSSLFQTGQFTLNWNHASAGYRGAMTIYNGGAYPTCPFTGGFTANKEVLVGGTYNPNVGSGRLSVYRNGILENFRDSTGNGLSGVTVNALQFMGGTGSTVTWNGGCTLFYWDTKKALSDAQMADLSQQYWSLFAPPRRIWVQLAASAGTGGTSETTGTASITPSPQTLTGAGAVAVAGTATISPAAQTATAAATVGITGTLNATQNAQAVSATGTVLTGVTGTASITPAAQTVTASGTIPIAATASVTPTAQTATIAGAVALLATATFTPAAQTVFATGVVVSGVVGSAGIAQAAQTVTAGGAVPIAATAALTPAAQTLTGAAAVSGGAVTGTATITPTAQTVSATAAISGGTVTGTANVYVNAQTLVAQASIIVLGTATITPAPQTLLGREAGALPEEIPESSRTLASTAPRLGSEIVVVEPARLGRSPVHRNRPRLG